MNVSVDYFDAIWDNLDADIKLKLFNYGIKLYKICQSKLEFKNIIMKKSFKAFDETIEIYYSWHHISIDKLKKLKQYLKLHLINSIIVYVNNEQDPLVYSLYAKDNLFGPMYSNLLIKSYPFVRNDIFLSAIIERDKDNKNPKQLLLMSILENKTKIKYEETISCIHHGIATISTDQYKSYQEGDDLTKEEFHRHLWKSSENSKRELKLSIEDNFNAFCQWVRGMSQYGMKAYAMQKQIEDIGNVNNQFMLSGKLAKFLMKIDDDFLLEFLDNVENYSQGSESCKIANLNYVIEAVNFNKDEKFIKRVLDIVVNDFGYECWDIYNWTKDYF